MAKKEQAKKTKLETVDTILELINIWTVPVIATIALLWGFDPTVYVLAIVGALNSILECVKVFLKKQTKE